MLECNQCGRGHCKILDQLRRDDSRGKITPEIWRMHCKSYQPLAPLKTTVLEMVVVSSMQPFVETMTRLGMCIVQQNKYPFFKIVEQGNKEI